MIHHTPHPWTVPALQPFSVVYGDPAGLQLIIAKTLEHSAPSAPAFLGGNATLISLATLAPHVCADPGCPGATLRAALYSVRRALVYGDERKALEELDRGLLAVGLIEHGTPCVPAFACPIDTADPGPAVCPADVTPAESP